MENIKKFIDWVDFKREGEKYRFRKKFMYRFYMTAGKLFGAKVHENRVAVENFAFELDEEDIKFLYDKYKQVLIVEESKIAEAKIMELKSKIEEWEKKRIQIT